MLSVENKSAILSVVMLIVVAPFCLPGIFSDVKVTDCFKAMLKTLQFRTLSVYIFAAIPAHIRPPTYSSTHPRISNVSDTFFLLRHTHTVTCTQTNAHTRTHARTHTHLFLTDTFFALHLAFKVDTITQFASPFLPLSHTLCLPPLLYTHALYLSLSLSGPSMELVPFEDHSSKLSDVNFTFTLDVETKLLQFSLFSATVLSW